MTMRLYEVHPALSHFPIALLPTAVGADVVGRITDDDRLREMARITTPLAACTAALTGAAGLISQEQVHLHGKSDSILYTHRNLNFGLTAVTAAMSVYRMSHRRPGWGYLLLGVGAVAAATYGGYLGSKMVYDEGVGVERAQGVRRDRSPELRPQNLGDIVHAIGRDLKNGVGHSVMALLRRLDIDFMPSPGTLQRSIDADPSTGSIDPVPTAP